MIIFSGFQWHNGISFLEVWIAARKLLCEYHSHLLGSKPLHCLVYLVRT